jgi:glutamyl-tRNA synthetase
LTGRTASPGIFEITSILGKERVISRLQKAIQFIEERKGSDG